MLLQRNLSGCEILGMLGERFRDYRMRMDMTQKEVSEQTTVSIPTIYKFERGICTDMSIITLFKLLRCIGMEKNMEQLLPELPESPYLYKENTKRQRIRHPKK